MPGVAKNAGKTAVAISCAQSLNRDANPMPSTVRLSHPAGAAPVWVCFALINNLTSCVQPFGHFAGCRQPSNAPV